MTARVRRVARPFVRAARAFRGSPAPSQARRDPFAARRDPAGPALISIPPIVQVPSLGDGRVTLLMPTLEMRRMTGGPNTALNLFVRLVDHGVPLRIIASVGPLDDRPDLVVRHIEDLAGRSLGPSVTLDVVDEGHALEVAPDDVFVATWWPTAHIADAAVNASRVPAFIYLIQDFEPAFYAHSTSYALAMASYRMHFRAVFNESLLHDWFVERRIGRYDSESPPPSTSFEPAVDGSLFGRPEAREHGRAGRRHRLLFYGRPANERNCFDLGLRALRIAAQRGALDPSRWEVVSIGADVPELDLGNGQALAPSPWMEYAAYARLVTESDVMVALMLSPHTGYPALEMAATGGRVVTNVFGVKSTEALHRISSLIDGVEPEPNAIADAIVAAAAAVERGEPVSGTPSSMPSTWDAAFAETIPWLLDSIADLREAP